MFTTKGHIWHHSSMKEEIVNRLGIDADVK